MRTFSLTDHDTLAGYRDVVAAAAVPDGMTLIPGVEINALVTRDLGLWEGELHILGFGMDPDDDALRGRHGRPARPAAPPVRPDRGAASGDRSARSMPRSPSWIPGDDDALGRPTIARALMAAGFATSVEDAFARLIGHGAPGYVRRDGLGPEDAIRTIVAAGGVPVLAHFREAPTRIELLRELIDVGLAGLEVHYRTFDVATTAAVGAVAADLGLLATGGTDYHGDLGPVCRVARGAVGPTRGRASGSSPGSANASPRRPVRPLP